MVKLAMLGLVVAAAIAVGCAAPSSPLPASQQPPSSAATQPPAPTAATQPPVSSAATQPPAVPNAEPARSAELDAAIKALPVIARIERAPTVVVLRGHLSKRRAKLVTTVADNIVADVARRFVGSKGSASSESAKRAPVDVCLFESIDAYNAFADVTDYHSSAGGYYMGRYRLIAANLGRSVGNLRHELIHPLLGDAFRSRDRKLPAWFNEGMGSLYGSARVRKTSVTFLVNYRLRHVRKALRAGDLPTLAEIAHSGRDELYGDRGMTYYGLARYLVLYLDATGDLEDFYSALLDEEPTAARQLELLETYIDFERFKTWTRRLKNRRPAPSASRPK